MVVGIIVGAALIIGGSCAIFFRTGLSNWNSRASDKMLAPDIPRGQDKSGEYNGGIIIGGSILIVAGLVIGGLSLAS